MALFAETLASLLGVSDPGPILQFALSLVGAIFWITIVMTLVAFSMAWVKRKWNARLGDRIAVNRVGPFGLLILAADGLKMMSKEIIVPENTDRLAYVGAPILSLSSVLLAYAFVPWGSGL
ncbi:MAG: NADH-quinone oxidoreductase subunit H, partial [Halobacteria archaeon]|nr:NADH-quinone oxidoreductase subunit H [Halobacteria archaeon]